MEDIHSKSRFVNQWHESMLMSSEHGKEETKLRPGANSLNLGGVCIRRWSNLRD